MCCFKVMIPCIFLFSSMYAEEEKTHDIAIEININCPMSEELANFVKSIPEEGTRSTTYEEWKSSFVNNMTQLIRLIESGKVYNSSWGVKTDEHLPQMVNGE